MDISNCAKCKKVFVKISSPICEDCAKEEEGLFKKVEEYLRDHPDSTVLKISEETGVSTKKIYSYLREGRLEVSEKSGGIGCRMCSEPISSGNYCDNCKKKINQELDDMIVKERENSVVPEERRRSGVTMHSRNTPRK